MTSTNLRDQVAVVVNQEWETFAAAHPRLARVIDRSALVEQAVTCLEDTPEYRQALQNVGNINVVSTTLSQLLAPIIKRFLETLL